MTQETSLSISTQETPLLQNDPSQDSQPHPKIKNLKPKIFFLLRILVVLILAILILYYIYSKHRKKPEPPSPYASGLSDYYCHLTPHLKLCRLSMFSATNATAHQPGPTLLLATSLQLLITQLNHTADSIARAPEASNASLAGPARALHVPNSDRRLVESPHCFVRVYMARAVPLRGASSHQ